MKTSPLTLARRAALAVLFLLAAALPPALAQSRVIPAMVSLGEGLGSQSWSVYDFSGAGPTIPDKASGITPSAVTLATSGTVTFNVTGMLAGDSRKCVQLASGAFLTGSGGGGGGTNNPDLDLRSDRSWLGLIVFEPNWAVSGFQPVFSKYDSGGQVGLQVWAIVTPDAVNDKPTAQMYVIFRDATRQLIGSTNAFIRPAGKAGVPLVWGIEYSPAVSDDGGANQRLGTGLRLYCLGAAATFAAGTTGGGLPVVTSAIAAPVQIGKIAATNSSGMKVQAFGLYVNNKSPLRRDAYMALCNAVWKTPPTFMEGAPSGWLGGTRTPKRPCVLICTDLAEDPGDPIAIWQALSLHKQGLIEILGIENCIGVPDSTGIARAILQEAKELQIPLFHFKGSTTGLPTGSFYLGVNGPPWNTGATLDSAYPDSKTGFHSILKQHDVAAKGKVVITTWGYVRGLVDFANYDDGAISGKQLMADKVAGILSIAGAFDPMDGPTGFPMLAGSTGYYIRSQWLGTWGTQDTIPSAFGVTYKEWNVLHDVQGYRDLYTILDSAPISDTIPWVWHHIRPAVELTDRNATELDRGNTVYVGAEDYFAAGGAMRKIVVDFSNGGLTDSDTTARQLGRPAWEQGALLHLIRGTAGAVDAKGRIYDQLFEWLLTKVRVWIADGTDADGGTGGIQMTFGNSQIGAGLAAATVQSTALAAAGMTFAGPVNGMETDADASGFVHVVIRQPWTGFRGTSEIAGLINSDLRWLTEYAYGTGAPAGGGGGGSRSIGIGLAHAGTVSPWLPAPRASAPTPAAGGSAPEADASSTRDHAPAPRSGAGPRPAGRRRRAATGRRGGRSGPRSWPATPCAAAAGPARPRRSTT